MRSPVPDYLAEILDACGDDAGALAGYIPELASADPDRLAVCLSTIDGTGRSAGRTAPSPACAACRARCSSAARKGSCGR